MVDKVDPQTRSRMMAAASKARDTGPELALRRLLFAGGMRGYRVHRKDIPGKPDIAWLGKRIAIFVDGAFWHGHPSAFAKGKSGEFWDRKVAANIARDRRVDAELRAAGWNVLRIWDFELERDPQGCVERIRRLVVAGAPQAAVGS